MYALTGNTEGAVQILDELRVASKHAYVPPVAFAVLFAGLGKIDDAFHWLQKAVDERDGFLIHLKTASVFDSLRSDKRFSELLVRVGLHRDPGLDVLHPSAEPAIPRSRSKLRQIRHPSLPRSPFSIKLALGIFAAAAAAIVVYSALPPIKNWIWPPKQIIAIQPFKTIGWRSRVAPSCGGHQEKRYLLE